MRWHMCGAGWCVTCVWRASDVIKMRVYQHELESRYIWQGEHSSTCGNHGEAWIQQLEWRNYAGTCKVTNSTSWRYHEMGWANDANVRSLEWFAVVMRHVWGDYVVTLYVGIYLQLLLDYDSFWRVWKCSTYYDQVDQKNLIANCFGAENGCWGAYVDWTSRYLKDIEVGVRCGGGLISCKSERTIIFREDWWFSEKPTRGLVYHQAKFKYKEIIEFDAFWKTIWHLANFLS